MLPSPKRMKFLQDNENQQGERKIKSTPEISAQPINDRNDNVQLDLKHLAPISLEGEVYRWPEPNRLPIYKKVNKKFRGEVTKVMKRVFSNYYKLNQNGHFVWTNQLVINGEIDLNFRREELNNCFNLNNFKANVCDLKNPENSFYLQKVGNLGLGLFAKHDIPRGECVGEYTGELITSAEEDLRCEEIDRRKLTNYIFDTFSENLVIDAGAMGNHTRFINHSCEPNVVASNAIVSGVPRSLVVATEPIARGEQLFMDYTRSYFDGMMCECNTSSCFMPSILRRNVTDPNNSWLEEWNRQRAIFVDRNQAVVEGNIENFQGQPHLRNRRINRNIVQGANPLRTPENELLRRQLTYSHRSKLRGRDELLDLWEGCKRASQRLNESQRPDIEIWEED